MDLPPKPKWIDPITFRNRYKLDHYYNRSSCKKRIWRTIRRHCFHGTTMFEKSVSGETSSSV
jgi:hypothetical protein